MENDNYAFFSFYRFEYDKKMSELSCADDDHPLKPCEPSSTTSNNVEHLEGM